MKNMWKRYQKNEKIVGVDDAMQLHMRSLFNSILSVDEKYLYWKADLPNDTEAVLYVERAFAYELYLQWNLNTDLCSNPLYMNRKDYIVNAEISKMFVENISPKSCICYPDMVLHAGNKSDKNYIVCEIKRKETAENTKDAIVNDLNKLGFFLRDDLHIKYDGVNWKGYHYGVFILTDKYYGESDVSKLKPADIENYIYINKLKIDSSISQKIFCIIYDGKKLQYTNLKEIINKKTLKPDVE